MNNIRIENQTRDDILRLLNTTLIEAELKMTLEERTEIHDFANVVFNRMLNKLVKED
jgi:hypothetical protein